MIKVAKKKEYYQCFVCLKDLTGKIQTVEDKKYCYKCFILWRAEERVRILRQEKEWVGDWIKTKKFFCTKCKARKNDLEVCFAGMKGIDCLVCGTECIRLKVVEPKQMQPNYFVEL